MKLRDNKGSITMFVLVGLLFMSAFLILSYGSNVNKSKTAKEMFNIISSTYSYNDGDENAYMRAYTALRKQNAQEMTSSSENSYSLELTKTFYGPISNYRIYGNSIQDTETYGTPSTDNPVEVESVGDTNLFNPNATLEKVGPYLGINTTGIDKNYTLMIKLKEGKTIPSGYFGFVYYRTDTATSASAEWLLSNGTMHSDYGDGATYALVTFNPSDYYLTGICCYGATQERWDSIIDAFEITWVEGSYIAETMPEYIEYGKYRIPVKVNGRNLFNPNATLEKFGSTIGVNISKLNGNYTLKIELKEGKTVPNGSFGYTYFQTETSSRAANYLVLSGSLNPDYGDGSTYGIVTFNPADNYKTGIVCLSGTKEVWDSFVDAFEITLIEGIYTAESFPEYEQYVEPQTFNIYLDEPLRKVGDVADYIDFSTGKVVRKIGKIESYNGETIENEWISTTGELSEGATSIYQLATPDETESIEIPELIAFEDYTVVEVLTEVAPSKIEVTYDGYTFEK